MRSLVSFCVCGVGELGAPQGPVTAAHRSSAKCFWELLSAPAEPAETEAGVRTRFLTGPGERVCPSSPHLFAERPLVFPVLEAAAGQRVDTLSLAEVHILHLLVQEPL